MLRPWCNSAPASLAAVSYFIFYVNHWQHREGTRTKLLQCSTKVQPYQWSHGQGHKKFVLDEKRTNSRNLAFWTKKIKFTILDDIWPKNGQLIAEKIVKFFHIHWHYDNAFRVGLKNRCLELLGCEWINFLSQNEQRHRTAGTTS